MVWYLVKHRNNFTFFILQIVKKCSFCVENYKYENEIAFDVMCDSFGYTSLYQSELFMNTNY
jgi:hypothetical protein